MLCKARQAILPKELSNAIADHKASHTLDPNYDFAFNSLGLIY